VPIWKEQEEKSNLQRIWKEEEGESAGLGNDNTWFRYTLKNILEICKIM
jgi:hypothetical protein